MRIKLTSPTIRLPHTHSFLSLFTNEINPSTISSLSFLTFTYLAFTSSNRFPENVPIISVDVEGNQRDKYGCLYHGRFSNFMLGFVNSFIGNIPLVLPYNQKVTLLLNRRKTEEKRSLSNNILFLLFFLNRYIRHLMTSLKFRFWMHTNRAVIISWKATAWAFYTDRVIPVGWNCIFRTVDLVLCIGLNR